MRRPYLALVLAGALLLAAGACSKQKDTGFNNLPKPPAGAGSGGAVATGIKIVSGNQFQPAEFKAKAGEKVTWTDTDSSQPHNVVSDAGLFDSSPDCAKDTSKCLADGQAFSFTFTKPGTYGYYCVIHGAKGGIGMAGTVVVS